jgi:multicomponent K+:H+ antiporter subunit G
MTDALTSFILPSLISALILLGAAFVLLGSFGLAKLPDFFTRLHAPTKASTLGVSAILLASMVFFSLENHNLSLHELLIIIFLWLTAPISAMLMATVARHWRKED